MDYSKKGITIINKSGKEIRLEKYDRLDLEGFCNGFAIVSIGSKYGFINENGEELCPIKYDMCWPFREDNKPTMVKLNGKYGLLDKTGKEITEIKYDRIDRFSGSKAFAECGKQILYLNPDGTELPITVI